MKSALVTGANKGVGLATARALATLGIKVWIGSRSQERGRRAEATLRGEDLDVEFVQLDVTDADSIGRAAAQVASASPALDILVNNAGIMTEVVGPGMQVTPPSEASMERIREIYETNVFGVIAVTQAMLPMLRSSSAGRIVNVASRLGSFAHMTDENWPPRLVNMIGYGSSKAAMHLVTVSFAIELRDSPIKINAVSPGVIASDLGGMGAETLAGKPGFAPPEDGAALIVKYATLGQDGPTGGFYGPDGLTGW